MEQTLRRIILIDNDESFFPTLQALLTETRDLEAEIQLETQFEDALLLMRANAASVFLLASDFASARAVELVKRARDAGCVEPIILLTGPDDLHSDVEALQAGANDYVFRAAIKAGNLARVVRHAIVRRRSELEMRERLRIDKLITAMSMRFINLAPSEIETQIVGSLRLLGESTGVHRATLFLRNVQEGTVGLAYEWCAPGIPSVRDRYQGLPYERLRWVAERLLASGTIEVSSIDDLPKETEAFRELIKRNGVRSFIVAPLLSRGILIGAVCFSSLQDGRTWHSDIVHLLKIAAEILGNALEQRRVQQALRDSERIYRNVVEGLGEGVILCDSNDIILQVNTRLAELTGYTADEMIGECSYNLLSPPGEEHILRARTLRRLEGIAEQYEIRLRRKNGTLFWAQINATAVQDEMGNFVGTLGAITDVSDKVAALAALRDSEKKYRDLVETSSDLIWSLDREGCITFVNRACREIYGYVPEEMMGKKFTDFVVPSNRDRNYELFNEILQGKILFQYETTHLRRDGGSVVLSINAIPLRSSDGTVIGATGTANNVTARKQSEEEVRNQKEFLRLIIDTDPNMIFVKDSQFRFTLVNKAFAEAYGLTPQDIEGKTDADIHDNPQEVKEFVEECREVLESGQAKEILERAVTYPGTRKHAWHYTIRKPFILPDGRTTQVLSVAMDITRRKHAEFESIDLQRRLLQSQKLEAIGQLAAGVAHDLNNALAAVVGHLQLLEITESLSPTTKDSVDVALGGCERALSLIGQLLGFSRQGKYNISVLSVQSIVQETVTFLRKVLEKDIAIEFEGNNQNLFIYGDPGQVQQVLTNLILNSKQAMPKGGTITFRFESTKVARPESLNHKAKPGDFVVLSVADTGVGIPEQNIDKIFEPFFTTKEGKEGSGLGLSMVYGIMQSHGGWVEVKSTTGSGSLFSLYFPRAKEEDMSKEEKTSTQLAKGSGLVLVIDDEPILVDLSKKFLELAGISAMGFTTGSEAITWYESNSSQVDLIILDMKMAKMDGKACFDAIRQINPQAQVAILSGYVQDAAAQDLLSRGALRFFQKPLKYPELVKWVTDTLGKNNPNTTTQN